MALTVRVQVCRAACDMASRRARGDLDRNVETVDDRDVVEASDHVASTHYEDLAHYLLAAGGGQGELGQSGRRYTRASVGVALETAVATTIIARIRAWVRREITVATTPDATSLPVVRDSEGDVKGEGSEDSRKEGVGASWC